MAWKGLVFFVALAIPISVEVQADDPLAAIEGIIGDSLKTILSEVITALKKPPVEATGHIKNYFKNHLKLVDCAHPTGISAKNQRTDKVITSLEPGTDSVFHTYGKTLHHWAIGQLCTFQTKATNGKGEAIKLLVRVFYKMERHLRLSKGQENLFGISVCDASDKKCQSMTEEDIKKGSTDGSVKFHDYRLSNPELRVTDGKSLCVVGVMSSDKRAEIFVHVYPMNYEDLEEKAKVPGMTKEKWEDHIKDKCED